MSYSLMPDYDVRVSMTHNGLCCYACSIVYDTNPFALPNFVAKSTEEMIEHLNEHKKRNERLPSDIFKRLRDDDEENFPNLNSDEE